MTCFIKPPAPSFADMILSIKKLDRRIDAEDDPDVIEDLIQKKSAIAGIIELTRHRHGIVFRRVTNG